MIKYKNGDKLRKETEIEEMEEESAEINIVIPENILSVNPSFLEGFLGTIIKKLGRDEFEKKFRFYWSHDIKNDIEEVIQRIERES